MKAIPQREMKNVRSGQTVYYVQPTGGLYSQPNYQVFVFRPLGKRLFFHGKLTPTNRQVVFAKKLKERHFNHPTHKGSAIPWSSGQKYFGKEVHAQQFADQLNLKF
jgi:hypothetical protein